MSITSPHSLRRTSSESRRTEDQAASKKVPEKDFKELLKAEQIAEESRGENFFEILSEKKKDEETSSETALARAALHAGPHLAALSSSDSASCQCIAASQITALSSDLEALFEKMASQMIVMTTSYETSTTFFLEGPQFASSTLLGTQIIIREFSTSPKAFNVEIISSPQAAAAIDASKNSFFSQLEKGNFNFTVHRLDTYVQHEEGRPVLHRKEEGNEEQKEQRGDGNP